MLKLSKYLKKSTLNFLEISKKNEQIARERTVSLEKFQSDIENMVKKVKEIIDSEGFEVQSVKSFESDGYDLPHDPEVTMVIKVVFADTFDDDFLDKFEKLFRKKVGGEYETMILDDNHQKIITIDVTLKLKKFLSMEM